MRLTVIGRTNARAKYPAFGVYSADRLNHLYVIGETGVHVQYRNEEGLEIEEWFEGFLARVIQHEFDHIEGIVFLDKLATTRTVKSSSEFRKT